MVLFVVAPERKKMSVNVSVLFCADEIFWYLGVPFITGDGVGVTQGLPFITVYKPEQWLPFITVKSGIGL